MLRPAMTDILQEDQSYYSFVVAIAKRAREIVDEYEKRDERLEEKAVNLSVYEFANKEYKFIEDDEVNA